MSFRSAVAREVEVPGLCDLSASLRSLRLQGPATAGWLRARQIDCPETLFEVSRQGNGRDDLWVARVGNGDVILQDGIAGETLIELEAALGDTPRVFRVPEQATTLRLSGPKAEATWRQTCAVPLAEATTERVVYSRVAGVSCAIFPERIAGERSYRIWVDYSLAPALWQSLAEILTE